MGEHYGQRGFIVNNKLNHVRDQVSSGNYPDDIDNESVNNYRYDYIGNLTGDVAEGLDTVRWNVYGKINRVVKDNGTATLIDYGYDAGGNRTMKRVSRNDTTTTTYYVRDAQGNTMGVYSKVDVNDVNWDEQHLYGSSRLGVWNKPALIPPPGIGNISYEGLELGARSYELSNHLGNVLSTISDKKIGNDSSGVVNYYLAEVLSQNDYYPFGMLMPEKRYAAGNQYRYGAGGGQELSIEIGDDFYTAEYWQYDSKLARRWNVDPSPKPYETAYAAFANNPILFIDPNGADTIDVRSRTFDYRGRRAGQRGFDKSNMLKLFSVYTNERHTLENGDNYEMRYDMFANDFNAKYSLNYTQTFHQIIDSERKEFTGRQGARVLQIYQQMPKFGEAIMVIGISELDKERAAAISDIKSRWISPLNVDKLALFGNDKKHDVKKKLLRGFAYTYVNGVGIFESDYLGNLLYGAIMSNFQSLSNSLSDGDFLQNTGYDDVFDSHAIIVGHLEGKSKISLTTFERINSYNLEKFTQIQGKVYNEYDIHISFPSRDLNLKTNN